MSPRLEKLMATAASVGCAVLAYYLADDEAVRSLLLVMAGAGVGSRFPRAEERELRRAQPQQGG